MSDEILMTADIIDYLGKYENGVLVLLSIGYKGEFSEGTIYYSNEMLSLTVDESIEEELGMKIELWDGYRDLLISILKKVVPYNEIINRLDEVDFTIYVEDDESTEGEEVDDDDIDSDDGEPGDDDDDIESDDEDDYDDDDDDSKEDEL
jgi:hypothetical protein